MKKIIIPKEVCMLIFMIAIIVLLSYLNVTFVTQLKSYNILPDHFILPFSRLPLGVDITIILMIIEFFVVILIYSGIKKYS